MKNPNEKKSGIIMIPEYENHFYGIHRVINLESGFPVPMGQIMTFPNEERLN